MRAAAHSVRRAAAARLGRGERTPRLPDRRAARHVRSERRRARPDRLSARLRRHRRYCSALLCCTTSARQEMALIDHSPLIRFGESLGLLDRPTAQELHAARKSFGRSCRVPAVPDARLTAHTARRLLEPKRFPHTGLSCSCTALLSTLMYCTLLIIQYV